MSPRALLLRVILHEPRYHGQPEWPPSPARTFQALVAAAGPEIERPDVAGALKWLEQAPPPIIATPRATSARPVRLYVPNNDLDSKGGDPSRIPELRTAKEVRPKLLDPDVPLLYIWPLDEAGAVHVAALEQVAKRLYQLGRGRDTAFATLEELSAEEVAMRLADHPGPIHRPDEGTHSGSTLACPRRGTLESLRERHAAFSQRFQYEGPGKSARVIFVQPPRARVRLVAYGAHPERALFELRAVGLPSAFAPIDLTKSYDFVVAVRDAAQMRLAEALPGHPVLPVLVGRRPGEPLVVRTEHRARLVPLPSIGHDKTDPSIRRVLVEIPRGGPLRPADVRWAFANLEVDGRLLVDAADLRMRDRYLAKARSWRSITPLALPVERRRIEPTRRLDEAKGGSERLREEAAASRSVATALRHAGVRARLLSVSVQREPLHPRGARAEAFEAPPRFRKERLWHVSITLDRPVSGPLVLGDGRFLGLGIMTPDARHPRTYAWQIHGGLTENTDPAVVTHALRRAVIARAQAEWGPRKELPAWVSGHEPSGRPAAHNHAHLAFVADLVRSRLLVVLPAGRREDVRLARAFAALSVLRAGRAGVLELQPFEMTHDDPLLASSRRWRTISPYRVNHHRKRGSVTDAVASDVREACRAQGLPEPVDVRVRSPKGRPGIGLEAEVELEFASAVPGPMLLGRSRHTGGGVFAAD